MSATPPSTGPLSGRRIAVLEARLTDALAGLLEREGATVLRAPALAERPRDAAVMVASFLDSLAADAYTAVIFQTGVGASALLTTAERAGRLEDARAGLARTTTVCRGPKPTAVLSRYRIPVSVSVPAPWTTTESIETVRALPIAGRRVALLHYGERNEPLAGAIQAAGAALDELVLYEWSLPDDVRPLEKAVEAICSGGVDAVVFTTQVQGRHLFEIARRAGRGDELARALRAIVVAAVGPTSAAALRDLQVEAHVVPTRPKMGPLVTALVEHMAGEAPQTRET